MRTLGLALLLGGLFAFFYCSMHLAGLEPLPAGIAVGDSMRQQAGRWELARYGTALAVLMGVILSVLPRAR
jgi:hypothetical protein